MDDLHSFHALKLGDIIIQVIHCKAKCNSDVFHVEIADYFIVCLDCTITSQALYEFLLMGGLICAF